MIRGFDGELGRTMVRRPNRPSSWAYPKARLEELDLDEQPLQSFGSQSHMLTSTWFSRSNRVPPDALDLRQTDTHRALLVDEVLENILDHSSECQESRKPPTNLRFLNAFGRVCKAWKEPALNRLWAKLDGPHPLMRLVQRVQVCSNCFRCVVLILASLNGTL